MGVCTDSREADCETYLPPKTPERKSLWLELEHLWFFGAMTRQDATDLLHSETEAGIFLVRNSSSLHGDLVLSVKEFPRVSHYIIHKVLVHDQTLFKIGEHVFSDMPALLQFYKNHYVDTTPLLRPVAKQVEKVRARYNFNGSGDAEDLPFKKGDILTIVSKDEELWWTARNFVGDTGLIPVNYVEKFEPELYSTVSKPRAEPRPPTKKVPNRDSATELPHVIGSMSDGPGSERNEENRGMIVKVRVKQARVPNAYDKSALRLNVGDVISVVARHDNGQWEGHLRGRVGFFPVTHVEFLEVSCRDVEV